MPTTNVKVNDLIKRLQHLKKIYGNIDLVSASDDEGNSFGLIWYLATAGHFDGEGFESIDETLSNPKKLEVNAICVN